MLQDKNLDTDNIQALLTQIEKISAASELDLAIENFLDLLKNFFAFEEVFFAIHGGTELIIKSKNYKNKINKQTQKIILDNIAQGKKTNHNSLLILPLKIHNQFIACLGIEKSSSEANELAIEFIAGTLAIAINQNQFLNDIRINNEKLLLLDKQKTELISTISHELRTPMANIMGFSELLLSRDFDAETSRSYIKEIHDASLRLSNLISNFLDLSRLEINGFLQFNNLEEAEIDWLAERAWQQLPNLNKNHRLILNKDPNLSHVLVDNDAITRVFINLFSNAIKYSPQSQEIICNITNDNDAVLVEISDKGIGIEEQEIDKIFERFYRINDTQSKFINGSGLGLWITREIISSHGGKIWVESKIGEGSKFMFTIPKGII